MCGRWCHSVPTQKFVEGEPNGWLSHKRTRAPRVGGVDLIDLGLGPHTHGGATAGSGSVLGQSTVPRWKPSRGGRRNWGGDRIGDWLFRDRSVRRFPTHTLSAAGGSWLSCVGTERERGRERGLLCLLVSFSS